MILERSILLLVVFVAKAFAKVSKEEAVLAAATSFAIRGKNVTHIEQRLNDTILLGEPAACNRDGKFACMITTHLFNDTRLRLG